MSTILLWTFLSSLALDPGLAFAAQLEAVRAGCPEISSTVALSTSNI